MSGAAKHSITITGHDDGKSLTVKDLSEALTQATGVPSASQKLIFKGTVGFFNIQMSLNIIWFT